ncbi:Uncharacterized protein YwbE [Colletotrichum chlorophyti]|uniref:Uncharacterized protein YwbE n=1 Tax=Colletotrichum chlorophyti TaxID=708187 RepID=A0A1Q8S7E8_9PEZI|nr:Uncharacterized protein YwbE [Colletotrichum chlorophyti]
MSRVPTTVTVIRGASVNIVLKKDQPTGRTVAGTVQDVLTRGNHPRGIKVRLTDGRIGRVQSHAGAQPSRASAEQEAPETFAETAACVERRPPRHRQGRRQESEAELPPSQVGLEAYIRPSNQKSGARGGRNPGAASYGDQQQTPPATSEIVTCPVCGTFEGDAAAVEHHVAGHFD